jgi:hypothetical protein
VTAGIVRCAPGAESDQPGRGRLRDRAGIPDPRGRRLAGVVGEVPRLAAERPLDAVGELGVAPVEDLGEQVAQQAGDVVRHAMIGERRPVVVDRHRDEPQVPAGRPADLLDRLRERQQPRTGQLVHLPGMPVPGQRRDGDVGDVAGVEERLGHVRDRERDLAGQHRLEQVALAEVLVKPAAADDGPVGTGRLQRPLGALSLVLAAAREQDQPVHAGPEGLVGERRDRLRGAGHREVREERDVRGRRPAEHGSPRRLVLPVKRRVGRARSAANRQAALPQPLDDATAGLARPADHQRHVMFVRVHG